MARKQQRPDTQNPAAESGNTDTAVATQPDEATAAAEERKDSIGAPAAPEPGEADEAGEPDETTPEPDEADAAGERETTDEAPPTPAKPEEGAEEVPVVMAEVAEAEVAPAEMEPPATPEAHAHAEHAAEEHEAIHLPDPSIWPFVIAVGITIVMLGIVLHLAMVVGGVVVVAFGIGGWIYQDIQVARRSEHH